MELLEQGYGIMPNVILYDKELKRITKSIFVVISSLCAEKGYCRASNEYIANIMGVSEKTVSRSVNELVDKGYIYSKIDKNNGNKRVLTLSPNLSIPMDKNVHTYGQKCPDINIIDNIIYIASYDDIKEVIGNYEYRLNNNKLLKCLIKLVDLGYKVEKKEKEIKKFVDWLREKAEIYNYKLPDGNIAQGELLQVFDTWYEYHNGKGDVSNYLNSVLTFMRNYKQPHFKNKKR